MSRSARLAVGAALAAAILPVSCGGNTPESKSTDDQNFAPPYGIPPEPETPPVAEDAGTSEEPSDGGGVPAAMYGVPPP